MTATATAMLGLIAWTMTLTLALLTVRFSAMCKGHPANGLAQDGGRSVVATAFQSEDGERLCHGSLPLRLCF